MPYKKNTELTVNDQLRLKLQRILATTFPKATSEGCHGEPVKLFLVVDGVTHLQASFGVVGKPPDALAFRAIQPEDKPLLLRKWYGNKSPQFFNEVKRQAFTGWLFIDTRRPRTWQVAGVVPEDAARNLLPRLKDSCGKIAQPFRPTPLTLEEEAAVSHKRRVAASRRSSSAQSNFYARNM